MNPEDEARVVEIARREAGRLVHDRRRHILKDFGGVPLEGRLNFIEYQGTLQAQIDGLDIAAFLKFQNFQPGDRVQLLVLLDHWAPQEDVREYAAPKPPVIERATHESVSFHVSVPEVKDIVPVTIIRKQKPTVLQDGVLRALEKLGGSGRPREIYDLLDAWGLKSVPNRVKQIPTVMSIISGMLMHEWVGREGEHGSLRIVLMPKGQDILKSGSVL